MVKPVRGSRGSPLFALTTVVLLATACSSPPERTSKLESIDQRVGYRKPLLDRQQNRPVDETYIAASFSGGGTRAAALAVGALRALAATKSANGPMLNQLEIISSVSGGSVTAGYYALAGKKALEKDGLENKFLRKDVQGALIWSLFNPLNWFRLASPENSRIDLLIEQFETRLFGDSRYSHLFPAADKADKTHMRPYLVLNAADMDTGSGFTFTQDQFDLICADLMKFKLSEAVAASAAFPVALTAVTLRNHSPCEAQEKAVSTRLSAWESSPVGPRPTRVTSDLLSLPQNPGRFRRGTVASTYLNRDGRKKYVHLLDGGISDNLGLARPITLLTSVGLPESILNKIGRGDITNFGFLVVNARSELSKDLGRSNTPPGMLTMLNTVIGSAIDGTSFQLLDKLRETFAEKARTSGNKLDAHVIAVDFDFIRDPACRQRFKNVPTTWVLPGFQIDALLELGAAMVLESGAYKKLVDPIGAELPRGGATTAEACRLIANMKAD